MITEGVRTSQDVIVKDHLRTWKDDVNGFDYLSFTNVAVPAEGRFFFRVKVLEGTTGTPRGKLTLDSASFQLGDDGIRETASVEESETFVRYNDRRWRFQQYWRRFESFEGWKLAFPSAMSVRSSSLNLSWR